VGQQYYDTLFGHEWELTKSPAGAWQWQPRSKEPPLTWCPTRTTRTRHAPIMSTADIAMITDPAYLEISKRFHENPDQLRRRLRAGVVQALHRDMGPASRYLGPQVPGEELLWQDPVPRGRPRARSATTEIAELKATLLDSGLTIAAGLHGVGVGLDLPRQRQARRRQRRPHPPRAAEGLGRQPAGQARPVARELETDPGDFNARRRRRGSRSPT
jgi:hypothetical protein